MLEQSLYAVARLELGLTTKPDAVEWDPWNVLVQRPEQTPQPVPAGTRISTVFDELGRTLLILGAPGTGKTTLLLELTKDLLGRAEQDPNHPLPVVFNLSSWAVRQSSLATWLVDELWHRYQVPRRHAQTWIDKDLIFPLLDGLDEIASEHRSACVEAINAFRQEHGLVPMAVCSRLDDYKALAVNKLRLQGALVLQPLTRSQINHYLAQAGEPLAGVRAALQDDKTLWELLDTPLMLSIAALAYGKRSAAEMQSTGTLEERKTQLLAAYTDAMFERRNKAAPYTPQQTVLWLGWLAAAMAKQNQSVFYLEWLQPTWLPGQIPQWIVVHGIALLSGLTGGLVVGLVVGLIGGLSRGLLGGLGVGLGITRVLLEPEKWIIQPAETLTWRWSQFKENLGIWLSIIGPSRELFVYLVVGLVVGLVSGLVSGLSQGGCACLQHLILRFLLWRNNYAPWHYVRFLDYAAERVFLRKVGGGYVFIHRMLLEYFATLYPSNLEHKYKASEPFHRLES